MQKPSLNHSYRLVWSAVHSAFVAVAENVRGKGKSASAVTSPRTKVLLERSIFKLSAVAVAMLVLTFGELAMAELPTGGVVVSGTATIVESGNNLNINQTSNTVYSNWNTFNIGTSNAVNIAQPSTSAIFLANILSPEVTRIQGQLNANGQVFLINPNGILFSPTAQINVGGLVASTLNLSVSDFNAGNYNFAGASSNAIINQGNIIAANGGTVALIAAKVTNTGTIVATAGNVLIGAGAKVTLDLGGPVKLQVEQGAIDALISNGGAIQADGGYIYLTASAANDLATTVINNTGLIEAQTLETGEKGEIYLMGDMQKGIVEVGGIIDASAPNGGDGGFVETSGAVVNVANDALVTTKSETGVSGSWLIDPLDYYISATGGNMTGTAVSTALQNNGNFTIATTNNSGTENGDIFVNDSISWTSNSDLTLSAFRNIEVNQTITSSNSGGKLTLQYGQGTATSSNTAQYFINAKVNLANGQNFSTKLGNTNTGNDANRGIKNFTVISSLTSGLSSSSTNSGNYALGSDVNLNSAFTSRANLTGTFEGLGHTVSGLDIDNNNDNVGLFSQSSGTIRNIGIVGGSVEGDDSVGALVGSNSGTIFNSYSSATVNGDERVGGLVGENTGTITKSYATGAVVGDEKVGGLVGRNAGNISNSYATGAVSSSGGDRDELGGLVGENTGTITASYARGNVTGVLNASNIEDFFANDSTISDRVGGLVGYNNGGIINTSLATGDVTGNDNVGGLVGENAKNNNNNSLDGSISDSYATGNVNGDDKVGGLVGYNNGGNIYRTYSTGRVTGDDDVGGLVGDSDRRNGNGNSRTGNVEDSYWDTQTSGRSGSDGGTGRTTALMQTQSTFSSWDFNNTWFIAAGNTPFLRGIMGAAEVINLGSFTKTYDGIAFTGANVGVFPINSISFTGIGITDPLFSVVNAGDYVIVGPTSAAPASQFSSFVQYTPGTLTIAKRTISIADLAADNKVYDGNTGATFINGNLTNVVTGESITLGAVAGTFADKNAADDIEVTFDSAELTYGANTLESNYKLVDPIGQFSADITKRNTTVSDIAALDKTYDGNANATLDISNAAFSNLVIGESITIDSITGTFANKNAGNNKTVTLTDATYGGGNQNNYNITDQTTARADINKASLTVIADDKSKTYGDSNPNFTVSYDGFVSGETFASSDLRGTVVAGVGLIPSLLNKNLDAGDYTIGLLPIFLRSNNYDISYQKGTLTVDKATVTVAGSNNSNTYGQGLQGVGVTYTGFKNGQNENTRGVIRSGDVDIALKQNGQEVVGNQPDAGNYVVDLSDSDLNAKNYNFNYVDGSLKVNKAQLTVAFNDQSATYGDLFLPIYDDVSYTGFVYDQDYESSDLRGSAVGFANASFLSNAGNYAINRSRLLTSLRSDNYNINYVSGNLEIAKADLNVDVIDQTRQYGDANQPFTYSYSGFKNFQSARSLGLNGNVAYETDADVTSNVGSYSITATNATESLTLRNYNLIFNDGNLDVTPRKISVVGDSMDKFLGAPDPVFGFTVGGNGLVNGDTLNGILSRVPGQASGNYLINGNGLSNFNYFIETFTPGELTILGVTQSQNDAITNAQNASRASNTPSSSTFVIQPFETAAGGDDEEEKDENAVIVEFVGNGVSVPE